MLPNVCMNISLCVFHIWILLLQYHHKCSGCVIAITIPDLNNHYVSDSLVFIVAFLFRQIKQQILNTMLTDAFLCRIVHMYNVCMYTAVHKMCINKVQISMSLISVTACSTIAFIR